MWTAKSNCHLFNGGLVNSTGWRQRMENVCTRIRTEHQCHTPNQSSRRNNPDITSSLSSSPSNPHHHHPKPNQTKNHSRHRPNLSNQPTLLHPLQKRFSQRSRRQQPSAHLMRGSLVARNSDSSFGEQHAGEVVHAAVVAHATHDAFGIAGVRNVGVGEGAPFDEFFAGLSVVCVSFWLRWGLKIGRREGLTLYSAHRRAG
jgi:hypothetical protein